MKYKFLKATGEIYEEVIRLLEDNSLPTSDLAGKELYALLDEDGKLLGSGACSFFWAIAAVASMIARIKNVGFMLYLFLNISSNYYLVRSNCDHLLHPFRHRR